MTLCWHIDILTGKRIFCFFLFSSFTIDFKICVYARRLDTSYCPREIFLLHFANSPERSSIKFSSTKRTLYKGGFWARGVVYKEVNPFGGELYSEVQCTMANSHMPPPLDRQSRDWKHYLPAKSLAKGNDVQCYRLNYKIYIPCLSCFWWRHFFKNLFCPSFF